MHSVTCTIDIAACNPLVGLNEIKMLPFERLAHAVGKGYIAP